MKESIRDNLKMIEDNLDKFNDHALRFIDKKEIRKYISIWRWYVSHDYFNEKHPQPEGIHSKPPIGWLDAQLKGLTVPLARDIGRCMEPVPNSLIMTEHAAHRIRNALTGIYRYISPEDMQKNAERKYKEKEKQRKALAERRERDRAESLKKYDEETRRLKRSG